MIEEYLQKHSASESSNSPEVLQALKGEKVIGYIPHKEGYLIVFESMNGFWFHNSTGAYSILSKAKTKQAVADKKRDLEDMMRLFKSTEELLKITV